MLLTLEETKQYLIVDYNEHDKYIEELIQSAEDYLIDSIDDYSIKIANDRFKRKARLCALVIVKDCYDNKSFVTKDNERIRTIISSILLQMQYGNYEVANEY